MVVIVVGMIICILAASVQLWRGRREPAATVTIDQPNRRRHLPIWLVLIAIPVGLLIDYLLMWLVLFVLFTAALVWVFLFGPLRPIHAWFM